MGDAVLRDRSRARAARAAARTGGARDPGRRAGRQGDLEPTPTGTLMLLAEDFAFVQKLVLKHAAILLNAGQEYLVKSRLEPVAREAGLADLSALVTRLRKEPYGALHATVVEAMTTNETSFFRDLHPFETLKKHVLPELIARR